MAKTRTKTKTQPLAVALCPVGALRPSPDNYRQDPDPEDPDFLDLVASIKAVGVLEPLLIRSETTAPLSGARPGEVLSGHRRLAAAQQAGLGAVPVQNLGPLSDCQAYDILAMTNLHRPLHPLEEGKRAALWLDKYGQDARAVASKLGKTERFIVEHAQIHRGLSAAWRAFALRDPDLRHWTASHWVLVARLPAALQAEQLAKFQKGQYFGYARWAVARLATQLALECLYLSQAPFPTDVCGSCTSRSDAQPLLWGDPEEVTGKKARCLEAKCWQKRATAAQKRQFQALAAEKGLPDAVPICLLAEPKDWFKRQDYGKKLAALRKAHPKLLTAEAFRVVEKGVRGAVAALVVAGGRKGVKWIKIKPPKAKKPPSAGRCRGPAPEERAAVEAEEQRWRTVEHEVVDLLLAAPTPPLPLVALMAGYFDLMRSDEELQEDLVKAKDLQDDSPERLAEWVRDTLWARVRKELGYCCIVENTGLQPLCDLLGIAFNVQARYEELRAAEKKADPVEKTKKARKVKKVKKVKKAGAAVPACRVCHCTDDDCRQCIEKTGQPCYWVEPDLCSACATAEERQAFADQCASKVGTRKAKKETAGGKHAPQ